nr:YcxB family protein [uncultured Psychroserpens sp.]
MNQDIVIKPKFEHEDLVKVNLGLYSKIPLMWIAPLVLCYLFFFKPYLDQNSQGFVPQPSDELFPYLQIAVVIFILCVFYFSIRRSTKKMLNNNPRIKEDISYMCNAESFTEKGDTFEIKHFWKDLHKIEEKKKWYLIYIQKRRAIIVRKEDFDSEESHANFRTLIDSISINTKLKK